jgi:Uma2 family endonuclease
MALPLKALRPVTDEELLELSERNPGYQFERNADGDVIVTPAGGEAGWRENELGGQLRDWLKRHARGRIFSASTMFILPDGSRFMPDTSWVRSERYAQLTAEQREGWLPLCPDAAFEIRSVSQPLAALQRKMRAYIANGAQIAVLIDPYAKIVEVHRPGRPPEVHTNPATVALDPELSEFALELGPIFRT